MFNSMENRCLVGAACFKRKAKEDPISVFPKRFDTKSVFSMFSVPVNRHTLVYVN